MFGNRHPKMKTAKEIFAIEREFGAYIHPREIMWKSYQGTKLLIPDPQPSYLFRGQYSVHRPSRASLFRDLRWSETGDVDDLSLSDKSRLVASLSQTYWFTAELESHYFYQDLKSKDWPLDAIGLAQHYGLPTHYIDWTTSFSVAAFFATNRYSEEGWEPVSDDGGVIYMLNLGWWVERGLHPYNAVKPLGTSCLPRPIEQHAWYSDAEPHIDYSSQPCINAFEFTHDVEVSRHYNDHFDCGHKLFPPDPAAYVAERIQRSGQLMPEFVDLAIREWEKSISGGFECCSQSIHELLQSDYSLDGRLCLMNNQDQSVFDAMWMPQMDDQERIWFHCVRAEERR